MGATFEFATIEDAGREMDALVAERIFGLVRCQGAKHGPDYPNTYCYALPDSPTEGGELNPFSTDVEHAWKVVEKLRRDWTMTLVAPNGDAVVWSCEFKAPREGKSRRYRYHYAVGQSAPHAICLAALKATPPTTRGADS